MFSPIPYLLFLLFFTQTLSLTLKHHNQHILKHSKVGPGQPFFIPMTKTKRSPENQKKLITFLQTTHNDLRALRSGSLIQRKSRVINMDAEPITLPLKNIMNTQYSGKLAIGIQENTFDVIFDTGSTSLFVNSKFCTQEACLERPQFDALASPTLQITDPPLAAQVTYGSGAVEGILVKENVFVGDKKAPDFILFLIDEQTGVLDDAQFEGVAGLSFPEGDNGSEIQVISIFDAIKDQLPQPYFSFRLRRNEEPDSYLLFGGYKTEDMASDIVWHDVIHSNYWMLKVEDITVGGKSLDFCKENTCGVVLDSGTSVMTAPEEALNQMQALIGDVSCDDISALPTLAFQVGGQKYELTPDEYVLTVDWDLNPEFYKHSEDIFSCSGTFTPMNLATADGAAVFVLGDIFFTKYYVVFDSNGKRIGLALQKRDK